MPKNPRKNSEDLAQKIRDAIDALPPYCMKFFVAKADTLDPKTRLAYAGDLRTFFWFLIDTMPDKFPCNSIQEFPLEALNTLTSDEVAEYMAYLDNYRMPDPSGNFPTKKGLNGQPEIVTYHNSASGKKRKLAALKTFFKYMVTTHKLSNDPTVYAETPKLSKKEVIAMSEKEEKKFREAVKTGKGKSKRGQKFFEKYKNRDYAIVLIFLETGVRVSELCDMELYDLDFEQQRILVIRKGGNQGFVYFMRDALEVLQAYLNIERPQLVRDTEGKDKHKNGPLFVSNRGTKISVARVEDIIKEYGRQVLPPNVKVSCHLLRKTCGSNIYNTTSDLALAQHALGHASPSTTEKYYVAFDPKRLERLKD